MALKNKRRLLAFASLAVIVLQLILMFSFNAQVAAAAPNKTIVVPNDYPTIAAAVSHASWGDTVVVKSGTYLENVNINKSITIAAQEGGKTVVIGKGGSPNNYVFNVTADDVVISGFTVESEDYPVSTPTLFAGGIAIAGNNCTVTGNSIFHVYKGIYVGGWGNFSGSISQTTIVGNNVTGAFSDGIRIFGGSGNVVSKNNLVANKGSAIVVNGYSNVIANNYVSGNSRGIGGRSAYSVIYGNKITNSVNWGMYFESSNNVVAANTVANNRWGVYLSYAFVPQNNTFIHNNFVNNTKQVNVGSIYSIQNWDNGYPSGGNYWSNYTGIDALSGPDQNQTGSDGIDDVPFNIGANNTDNYPLASAFKIVEPGTLPPSCQPSPIQNNVAALWHLDTLAPDMSTPDETGNNPLMFSPIPYLPNIVSGKFGQALNFTFYPYGVALASPSLDVSSDITIDAWIKLSSYENSTYNNILVMSGDSLNKYASRMYGFAVNGLSPANATSGPTGALCGYVWTDSGYNEIVTTAYAVTLDIWTHVVFTRSTTSGMHIYVNGVEQQVMVTSGSKNPTGNIKKGTEIYFGADYSGTIDEVRISNTAEVPQSQLLWLQWWFWTAVAGALAAISAGALYVQRKKNLLNKR
jgi:parallel beta-helix repeat protein